MKSMHYKVAYLIGMACLSGPSFAEFEPNPGPNPAYPSPLSDSGRRRERLQDLDRQYHTVTIHDRPFSLTEGQISTVSVGGGWRFVDKIWIRGQAYGTNARLEVWAEGDHVCDIELPRVDPSITCTIRATIQSIEFRHVRGGRVEIQNVVSHQSREPVKSVVTVDIPEAYGLPDGFDVRPLEYPRGGSLARYLCQETNRVVDALFKDLDPEVEYLPYLVPVKVASGHAYSVALSHGDMSFETLFSMLKLKKQIEHARPLLTQLLKRPGTYDRAVRLLVVMESIEDKLKTRKFEEYLKDHPEELQNVLRSLKVEGDKSNNDNKNK